MKRPGNEKILKAFRTWIGMPTYREERHFLENHLELLAPGAIASLRKRLRVALRGTRQSAQTLSEDNEWQKLAGYLTILNEISKCGKTVEAVQQIYTYSSVSLVPSQQCGCSSPTLGKYNNHITTEKGVSSMADQALSSKRWNLFARELEDILADHQFTLGQLDDRVGIHREKVRRLKQSLLLPKNFPVLNSEEMEAISEKLQLSDTEMMRLRAAVLATAIERVLMDRVSPLDALEAAQYLLPLISRAMQEQVNSITGMGAIRREDTISSDYDESDLALESAIEAIDKGTIALHLSYNVSSHTERIERAQEARHRFETAQVELDEVDDDIRLLTAWKYCYQEAQSRLAEVNQRLEDLGE